MSNIDLTNPQHSPGGAVSSQESPVDAAEAQRSLTQTEKRILDAGFAGFIIGAAAAALIFVFL